MKSCNNHLSKQGYKICCIINIIKKWHKGSSWSKAHTEITRVRKADYYRQWRLLVTPGTVGKKINEARKTIHNIYGLEITDMTAKSTPRYRQDHGIALGENIICCGA